MFGGGKFARGQGENGAGQGARKPRVPRKLTKHHVLVAKLYCAPSLDFKPLFQNDFFRCDDSLRPEGHGYQAKGVIFIRLSICF